MKGFLLAAGHGTRLRPLTDHLPKCLLPIDGTPMLRIWLELCAQYGIREVLINLHAHASQVQRFVDQQDTGVTVHVVEEPHLLGSAGTLLANAGFVQDEESFWVLYADVLTDCDLRNLIQSHRGAEVSATLGLKEVPDPRRCGIVSLAPDGIITRFEEKPHAPQSNLAFAGLMVARPAILKEIPQDIPSPDIGFHLLPRLAGRMNGHIISEYLIDIGTLQNYEQAQREWPTRAPRRHF